MLAALLARIAQAHRSGAAAEYDPYWENVQTLAVFTGNNGDTEYRDLRDSYPWIIAGNTSILAGASVMNNGFGNQGGFLWTDGSGDLASRWLSERLGDADFTIEALVAPSNGGAGAAYGRLAQIGPNSTNGGLWWIRSNNPNPLQLFAQLYASGYTNCINTPADTIANDQFVAVALTRQGNTYFMFYDGVLVGTLDNTNATAHNIVQTDLHIGGNSSNAENFRGRYNNLRITKGVARYTASYTPQYKAFPARGPATVDPDWWNVVSLLPLSGVAGATSFPDAKGRIWSAAGNAQISAVSKFGKGSLALDGSGDYLRCDDVARAIAGHDTFTIELWAQSTQQMTDIGNFLSFNDSSGGNRVLFQDSALYLTSANAFTYPFLPVDGAFHHVVLMNNQGFWSVHIDGAIQGCEYNTATISGADRCSLGQEFDSSTASGFFKGYFEQLRVTKGAARYTPNFTPVVATYPTSVAGDPLYADVVSQLQFDGADGAAIVDDKGVTWSAVGGAAISTADPLVGTGSLSLDGGTASYLSAASDPSFALGTGDFTIEWFAKQTAAKAIAHFDFRNGVASNSAAPIVYNNAASPYTDLRYYVNGADKIIAPVGTLVIGKRQHFAVCRENGMTSMYVDGVLVGSFADTTDYIAAGWLIGASSTLNTRGFNGQIDGFRVTKAARYSANFTPPTTLFADSVTVSLLHFDGAAGTSNITDAIGLLWTTTIAPAMAADGAAVGGLSCRFTGGAYLENTSKACWGFLHNGTSFTLEGFVTVDAIGATQAIVTNNGLSSANTGIGVWVDSAGALQVMVSRGVSTVPTVSASVAGAFTAGARVHLAVQYDATGNTYTIYVDGVQVWSGAPAQAFSTSAPTDALRLARNSSGSNAYSLTGNFDEWRITSGKARYTADFTPPTEPYSTLG